MATNPVWRKTLPQLRRQVAGWMRARTGTALLLCDILFDFRPIGDGDTYWHATTADANNLIYAAGDFRSGLLGLVQISTGARIGLPWIKNKLRSVP